MNPASGMRIGMAAHGRGATPWSANAIPRRHVRARVRRRRAKCRQCQLLPSPWLGLPAAHRRARSSKQSARIRPPTMPRGSRRLTIERPRATPQDPISGSQKCVADDYRPKVGDRAAEDDNKRRRLTGHPVSQVENGEPAANLPVLGSSVVPGEGDRSRIEVTRVERHIIFTVASAPGASSEPSTSV